MPLLFAVGSVNPSKIDAVRAVVGEHWPDSLVEAVSVSSGVGEMPITSHETRQGAKNRALSAQNTLDTDFGLGLEGGVEIVDSIMYLTGWVAACDRNGVLNYASAVRIRLPNKVEDMINGGQELGPVMDSLTGMNLTNHRQGAIGILTQNLVTRRISFKLAVACALAPWISPEYYE